MTNNLSLWLCCWVSIADQHARQIPEFVVAFEIVATTSEQVIRKASYVWVLEDDLAWTGNYFPDLFLSEAAYISHRKGLAGHICNAEINTQKNLSWAAS